MITKEELKRVRDLMIDDSFCEHEQAHDVAHRWMPVLLDEIERLQAENEKMAQAIEAWGDADNRNAAADAHDILHKIYEDLPKRGEP